MTYSVRGRPRVRDDTRGVTALGRSGSGSAKKGGFGAVELPGPRLLRSALIDLRRALRPASLGKSQVTPLASQDVARVSRTWWHREQDGFPVSRSGQRNGSRGLIPPAQRSSTRPPRWLADPQPDQPVARAQLSRIAAPISPRSPEASSWPLPSRMSDKGLRTAARVCWPPQSK